MILMSDSYVWLKMCLSLFLLLCLIGHRICVIIYLNKLYAICKETNNVPVTVLVNTNQVFRFLKACFLSFLVTLKWDSVISKCPFSTTFTLSYNFSTTPIFSMLNLLEYELGRSCDQIL